MARVSTRSLTDGVRRALTFWRRSIQARVVASTLVLSAVVVSVVGWFLLQQTRDGLLDQRVKAVLAEAHGEVSEAESDLAGAPGLESDATRQKRDLAEPIVERGQARDFSVLLSGPSGEGFDLDETATVRTLGLQDSSVPESMVERFDSKGAQTAWTYTTITTRAHGRTDERPGIVVASQVQLPADGETYTLYFLFPLEEQQDTLALVTRAMVTAGGLLLVLVAALTWLVTRQVVTPIRMARRVAERLAAGRLQERLKVTGEDDLARLATSFNQMASNLQRQIRQLEELSRLQRRFVSDVSHELRTPLTTVRMAGDVLHDAREQFDPATGRAAELLQTELDRFETLLVDLLEVSRFDAGAAMLNADDVNLGDIVLRVVEATQPLADQRGVRVRVEAPTHAVMAEADQRRVERILRNLITNAMDHTDAARNPGVVIRLESDEHAAAVVVRDYGIGLGPGESAMVFNRFWRADPARARTSGGTGLGLSISLEDTHLHGGWLQAWGRPGQGAQFRLTLPRHAGDPLRHSPLPLVPLDAEENLTPAPTLKGSTR
jgi:two-component system sensor histidine kinase MtrB